MPIPRNGPTPDKLAQLSLRILELGIVKPLDPVGSDDPREHAQYDSDYDPRREWADYEQAVEEALKLWDIGFQALAKRNRPGPFAPLINNIFETSNNWDKNYREAIAQGLNPDEALFNTTWPAQEVANHLYFEKQYAAKRRVEELQKLVSYSMRIRSDRWVPTEWERKLLADPFGRNKLVPGFSEDVTDAVSSAANGVDQAKPPMPSDLFAMVDFNGIEIRALLGSSGIREKVRSWIARQNGIKGGRKPKANKGD